MIKILKYQNWKKILEEKKEDHKITHRRRNKSIEGEEWYRGGEYHREDGPARIWYRKDGSVEFEEWYREGERHREDGPAVIMYRNDGSIEYEEWYRGGEYHREDGPFLIKYREDGSIRHKEWCRIGELHREEGPAVIEYSKDGSVESEEWYLDGRELTREEWKRWKRWKAKKDLRDSFEALGIDDLVESEIYFSNFNSWLTIYEQKKNEKYTIRDIWREYDQIKYGDKQFESNSPIMQVQKRILKILNSKPETKKWVEKNGFKPDNDFGKISIQAIGLALNRKEFKNPESISIGPITLEKLGFKKPPTYSLKLNILATTLVIEAGEESTSKEMYAIANVILNRKYAMIKYYKKQFSLTDIVLKDKQFSLWNGYDNISNEEKAKRAMRAWRPENRSNWSLAVAISKKMLSEEHIKDITNGATHYYNPKKVTPVWAKGETWIDHKLGLLHTFGRDTVTNWAKKPIQCG